MKANVKSNETKSIKAVVAESYKDVSECVTEIVLVTERLVAKTPSIVRQHAAKVNKEMDDIFAELGI